VTEEGNERGGRKKGSSRQQTEDVFQTLHGKPRQREQQQQTTERRRKEKRIRFAFNGTGERGNAALGGG